MSSIVLTKNYYTTGELAEICAVNPATIFRAIINKNLKAATTPGGHFRIPQDEARDFLERNNISYSPVQQTTFKILIVEDNPVERRMFQRAINLDPAFETKSTGSGYEAGFLTQSYLPDLILLDIFLPDIDGRQVAKLIRSDEKLKKIKIIAVSGAKDPEDLAEIKALRLDGHIQKPVTPTALRDKIRSYLS